MSDYSKTKILVITHSSNSIYGAARSLKSLLNNADFEFDLVYLNNLSRRVRNEDMLIWAGENCKNAYGYMYTIDAKTVTEQTVLRRVKDLIKRLYTWYGTLKIKKLLKKEEYDLLILNSVTLYKWIQNHIPTMIVVRCMLLKTSNEYSKVLNKIEHAEKVVFISPELREPFKPANIKASIDLPNPIDMSNINTINSSEIVEKYGLHTEDVVVISILGVVHPDKGIDFVIQSFKTVDRKDIMLLIVGNGKEKYYNYCKNLSSGDDRIKWIEETDTPEEIYKITDYVLRADKFFVVGRTVYEGLFSGCGVIIQGSYEDMNSINNCELYQDRIFFYAPRDKNELRKVFNNVEKKQIERKGTSNVDAYVKTFQQFMRK